MCWLLGAAAAVAAAAGAPDSSKRRLPARKPHATTEERQKTRPSRTGKHHGPEERPESKIGVSRGRNVPSEISYKKLAIRFFLEAGCWLAAGSLLARC